MTNSTPTILIFVTIALLSGYAIISSNHQLLYEEAAAYLLAGAAEDHRQLQQSAVGVSDPKTIEDRATTTTILPPPDDEDKLCIARVDDGTILSEAFMDNNGHFNLALPSNYEATTVTVECTKYLRLDPPPSERSETLETTVEETPLLVEYTPPSAEQCDAMNFHPGYFNKQNNSWHDHCSGRTTEDMNSINTSPLSKETCPILGNDREEDIWVLIVGDSVTGHWSEFLPRSVPMERGYTRGWKTGRWGKKRNDFIQQATLKKMEDESSDKNAPRIWKTFLYDAAKGDWLTTKYFSDWPYTWGDFMKKRKEGPSPNGRDPNFHQDKVPDFIFWSPGYHASTTNSVRFGEMVDNMLTVLDANYTRISSSSSPPVIMPQMHLLLNIMPAPWLIPSHYGYDKSYRTLLNEHRKNLAIIEAAKRHSTSGDGSGFVRGIVDVHSVELPFNGKEDGAATSVHGDAVHLGRSSMGIFRVVGDRIFDTICSSSGDLPFLSPLIRLGDES